MNSHYQLISFSGIAIVMWGLWGFFGKLALEKQMAPTTIFLAEILISALCAVPVVVVLLYRKDTGLLNASWNMFGLLSGAGLALGLLFYYLALEKGHVSVVVPLTATYPVLSVVLGYLFLNERISLSQWVGVILVVTGSVLLLSGPLTKVANTDTDVRKLRPDQSIHLNE